MANKLRPTNFVTDGRRDRISDIKDFLDENYEIRINLFDPSRPFIKPLKKEYQYPVEFRDICLDLSENGIQFSTNLLRMLISSPNRMKSFNPITDYFDSLRGKYKGYSHIEEFCRHLHAREWPEKESGYYQQRLNRYFKKWFVAAVACVLGIRYNDVAIGFIAEDEGMGKTHLTKFLAPDSLKAYRIDSINNDDKFDMNTEFTRNFIVNFDELVGITRGTVEVFKQVLSKSEIVVAQNGFSSTVKRLASATFTSNKTEELGGFLTPAMGTRRFLCLELESIDKSYSTKVDIDQMYAEALVLIEQPNFDYTWGDEDFAEFKSYNDRYLFKTPAYRAIKEFYRSPEKDDEPGSEWIMPMEILRNLKNARKISSTDNITEESLGMALRQLGFKRQFKKIKNEGRFRYCVIPIF